MTLLINETARPLSLSFSFSSLLLVLHFFIFKNDKQIRILFEKNSKTWSEMKEIIANILSNNVIEMEFLDSVTLGNIDNEDDGSCEFVNKLAVYSCLVKCTKVPIKKELPFLTIVDTNDNEIMFSSRPYLFRSQV
jgi:hypothetical protein